MALTAKKNAVDTIRQSYRVLSTESNLSPQNPLITNSLTKLVRDLSLYSKSIEISDFLLQTPELENERSHLPTLCAKAECEMEKYWAKRILGGEADIPDFWYHDEYRALVDAEAMLINGMDQPHSISFLGAGALPLTALMLADRFPQAKIRCVDFDAEATELARCLAHKSGYPHIEFYNINASEYRAGQGELVICASLLEGKDKIYKGLETAGCTLLIRDSEGIYRYLYKPADLPTSGFCEKAKTDIDSRRINTTRLFAVPKHGR